MKKFSKALSKSSLYLQITNNKSLSRIKDNAKHYGDESTRNVVTRWAEHKDPNNQSEPA